MKTWAMIPVQCAIFVLIVSFLTGTSQVYAQTLTNWTVKPSYETKSVAGASPLIIKDTQGLEHKLYDDSYAVFIMEEHYSNGWTSPVDEGERSQKILLKALEARGFHVIVWRDLASTQMRTTLDEMLSNIGYIDDARLFFYYFGHGTATGTNDDDERPKTFLVPVDAADPSSDLPGFYRAAIPIRRLTELAASMNLKHAFFALEACKAGGIFSSLSAPPPPNPLGYVFGGAVKKHVRQFLTAGNAEQDVPPGAFTALLVGALEEGGRNGDGYVTGSDVISYVARHAPLYSKDFPLDPEYGSIPPAGGGDMVMGLSVSPPVDPLKPSPVRPDSVVISTTTIHPQPASLVLGERIALFDGFTHFGQSALSFRDRRVVSWGDLTGDLLVSNTKAQPPRDPQASFFLPYDAPPYQDSRMAHAGIARAPVQNLRNADDCPSAPSYSVHWFKAQAMTAYCVRDRDGDAYGKIMVFDILEDRIYFDWIFQPSHR